MTCARLAAGVADQLGNAALAAATAAFTSSVLASGTDVTGWPIAGLKTSWARPLAPASSAPLM